MAVKSSCHFLKVVTLAPWTTRSKHGVWVISANPMFHHWLESRLEGKSDQATSDPRPKWDGDRRELFFGDKLIKTIRQRAENVTRVLDVFEEEKWAKAIDDPLPNGSDSKRRGDTLKGLNDQKPHLIQFGQIAGKFIWAPRPS